MQVRQNKKGMSSFFKNKNRINVTCLRVDFDMYRELFPVQQLEMTLFQSDRLNVTLVQHEVKLQQA